MPTSVPTPQPQPTTNPFPTSALNLFWPGSPTSPLFTNDPAGRSAALAAGFTVPAYDPTKPSKCWAATSWPTTIPQGYYDGTGNLVPLGADPTDPLNIWGPTEYPVYEPAPTPALYMGLETAPATFIDQQPVPASMLATQDQGNALALAWGLTAAALSDQSAAQMMTRNGETRGLWYIDFNGVAYNVGQQIALQNANGVGAPGHWDTTMSVGNVSQPITPVWVSDIPPLNPNPNPPRPIPQRQLLPNERLQAGGLMDPTLMVWTTPLAAGSAPSAGGSATLSAYQAAQLTNIESILVQMATQRLGLTGVSVTPKS
jgi:hypothetical protein